MDPPGNNNLYIREVWGDTQDHLESAVGTAYTSCTSFYQQTVLPVFGSISTCFQRSGEGCLVCLLGPKKSRLRREKIKRRRKLLEEARRAGAAKGILHNGNNNPSGPSSGKQKGTGRFYDIYDDEDDESNDLYSPDELEGLLNTQEYDYYYDDSSYDSSDDDYDSSSSDSSFEGTQKTGQTAKVKRYRDDESDSGISSYGSLDSLTAGQNTNEKKSKQKRRNNNEVITTPPQAHPDTIIGPVRYNPKQSALDKKSYSKIRASESNENPESGEQSKSKGKSKSHSALDDDISTSKQHNKHHHSKRPKKKSKSKRTGFVHSDLNIESPVHNSKLISSMQPHQRIINESQSRLSEFWKTVFPKQKKKRNFHYPTGYATLNPATTTTATPLEGTTSKDNSLNTKSNVTGLKNGAVYDDIKEDQNSSGHSLINSLFGSSSKIKPSTTENNRQDPASNNTKTNSLISTSSIPFSFSYQLEEEEEQERKRKQEEMEAMRRSNHSAFSTLWNTFSFLTKPGHSASSADTNLRPLDDNIGSRHLYNNPKITNNYAGLSSHRQSLSQNYSPNSATASLGDHDRSSIHMHGFKRARSMTKSSTHSTQSVNSALSVGSERSANSSDTYRSRRELFSDIESDDAQMVSDNFASTLIYHNDNNTNSSETNFSTSTSHNSSRVSISQPKNSSEENTAY